MSKMEKAILEALKNKNIQERNTEILNALEKSIKSLINRLKLNTRLNNKDDLLQEARIVVLEILSKNILHKIRCAKSTYILAAIKKRLLTLYSRELADKRLAQTNSVSLDYLMEKRGRKWGIFRDLILEDKILIKIIDENKIGIIRRKLSKRENLILDLLLKGNTYNEIAKIMGLTLSATYAIIWRKIKPIFLKNAKFNKPYSI